MGRISRRQAVPSLRATVTALPRGPGALEAAVALRLLSGLPLPAAECQGGLDPCLPHWTAHQLAKEL